MSPNDLLQHYGTKAAVAAAIGVDRQVVQGWFARQRVPLEQQTRFEVATAGKLKADVSPAFRQLVAESVEPSPTSQANAEASGQEAA